MDLAPPMKHVLIIDDSSVIRKYSRLIFESLGFRVSDTDNLQDALQRVQSDTPEFILVDWIVPGANSLDFIKGVRASRLEKRCHIIYVTTENDSMELSKALRAGADDYMLKPFNKDIVEMKLHEIKVAA